MLGNSGIGVYSGNKIIEVKPRGITKGVVAEELLASTGADFVLAIGDDYTDEDMFKALPESAYTIKVGFGETHARFRLPGVESVHATREAGRLQAGANSRRTRTGNSAPEPVS